MRVVARDSIRQTIFRIALLTSVALTGCSEFAEKFDRIRPSGYTDVYIARDTSSGALSALDIMLGGVMVYATAADGSFRKGIFLATETSTGIMRLPNGNYYFHSVGWTTTGMNSAPKCGFGRNPAGEIGGLVSLSGAATVVPISLEDATCLNAQLNETSFHNGTVPISLSLVLCSTETDPAAFTTGSDCQTKQESSLLLAGNASGLITNMNGTSTTALFTADPYTPGTKELFSTSLDSASLAAGPRQRRISGAMTGTTGVSEMDPTPNGNHVVYIATQDSSNPSLWVTPIHRQDPTKLSAGSGATIVKGFKITPDSNTVVYVADEDTTGKFELYAVNIDGTGKKKLNAAMTGPTGIPMDGGGRPKFDLSPNGTWAVYIAEQDTAGDFELYKAAIATAASSVKLNNAPVTGGDVDHVFTTPDSSRAVYSGDLDTDNEMEVYSVNLSGAPSQTKISVAMVTGLTAGGTVAFQVHKDHDNPTQGSGKVYYIGDSGTVDVDELHVVNPDGTGALTITDVDSVDTTANVGVKRAKFNEDGSKILYTKQLSAGVDNSRLRLFVANTSGSPSPAEMTDTSLFTGAGVFAGVPAGGNDYFEFAENDGKVVYIADQDATGGTYELWVTNVDGSGRTKLSDLSTSARDVQVLTVGGTNDDQVVYRADRTADNDYVLLHQGVSGTPGITEVNPTLAAGTDVGDFHFAADSKILFIAVPSGATGESLFARDVGTSTLYTAGRTQSPGTPAGRVRVHMLSYEANGDALSNSGSAIASACLTAPSSDGATIMSSVRIPAGLGAGKVPFVVGIEVFPLASSCSGSSIFYHFPIGLARDDYVTGASAAKLVGDGSTNLRLFLSDP